MKGCGGWGMVSEQSTMKKCLSTQERFISFFTVSIVALSTMSLFELQDLVGCNKWKLQQQIIFCICLHNKPWIRSVQTDRIPTVTIYYNSQGPALVCLLERHKRAELPKRFILYVDLQYDITIRRLIYTIKLRNKQFLLKCSNISPDFIHNSDAYFKSRPKQTSFQKRLVPFNTAFIYFFSM